MANWQAELTLAALLAWTTAACGNATGDGNCAALPCPMPMAVILTVTASGGGAVADLMMTVTGATSATGRCTAGDAGTTCYVPGTAGTYAVRLSAPGFQEKVVNVTVAGSNPPCGCASVQTEHPSVVLTRS
jgi:hypothetical protein